jgi:hypothetical protein
MGTTKTVNQMADQEKKKGKQLAQKSKKRVERLIHFNLGIEAICNEAKKGEDNRTPNSTERKRVSMAGKDKHNSMAGTDKTTRPFYKLCSKRIKCSC